MTNTFYIYIHRRPDSAEVFYVGKGTRTPKKAYGRSCSGENRNPMWRRIVSKCGGRFDVEVLVDYFSEADAFSLERDLILQYGRKNLGRGTLANMTDGGEGAVGRIVKPETIERFRRAMAGKPQRRAPGSMLGRKHTIAARAAISAASVGSNNPMFGRKHGDEYRAKVLGVLNAGAAKKARPVVDTATGALYRSARAAALAMGFKPETLKSWLIGRYRNKSSLEYA